ncbi:unnamed protein product [Taenia asiatica]|uniref:Serine/threonine protein phosphatase 2A regulatory subunit n=1 Tax=Taenia asiatica TaxID=60517 RepID=A0A158R7G1_TAEAS|nr:unnamed protein product [Taenia asiatica]
MSLKIEPYKVSRKLSPIPASDTPEEEHLQLLIEKLNFCCTIFDFTVFDPSKLEGKKAKTAMLREVSEYLFESPVTGVTSEEEVYAACANMFAVNIFRPLPPPSSALQSSAGDPYEPPDSADEEDAQDPAWPHLEIVYEIFLRFLSLLDIKILFLKKYVDRAFVLNLFAIFDTVDRRERACAKMILHKIYAKIIQLRAFIREQIIVTLQSFVCEAEQFNGIGELLEIFGSIVSGYQTPLKEEHIENLQRVILPLHKPQSISAYHPQLAYCIAQFLEKDTSLLRYVVNGGILKYWPKTQSAKAVMFLNELEEFLEMTTEADFESVMVPVFKRLAAGYTNCHFQLAERSLIVTYNATIFSMAAHHADQLLPIVLPALKAALQHWHIQICRVDLTRLPENRILFYCSGIQGHAETILDKWKEVDPDLFERCMHDLAHSKEMYVKVEIKRIKDSKNLWSKIEKCAAKHSELVLNNHTEATVTDDVAVQDSVRKATSEMLNGGTLNHTIPTRYAPQ